jgi:hypothetical protein
MWFENGQRTWTDNSPRRHTNGQLPLGKCKSALPWSTTAHPSERHDG